MSAHLEPADDVVLAPARSLPQQALWAAEVDEVRLEPLQLQPGVGEFAAGPARPATAGLIDPQHGHGSRLPQQRLGVHGERRMGDRPAHQPRTRDADRLTVADRRADLPTQPVRDPRPSRQLRDLLGEGLPGTPPFPAGVLHLVPAHRKAFLAVGHVPRRGRAALPDRARHHATGRAERRHRVGGHHMHQAGWRTRQAASPQRMVGDMFDVSHPHSGQAEQDGPTVGTRGSLCSRLESTESIKEPRVSTRGPRAHKIASFPRSKSPHSH